MNKIIVDREYEIVEEQHIYRGLHSIVYRVKTETGYYILKELFPNEIHNISKCPRNKFNCPCLKNPSVVIDTCAFIQECEREIEACRIAYVDEAEKSNSNYFFKSELLSKVCDNDTYAQYILVDTSSGVNLRDYAKEILPNYDSEKYLSCIAELMSSACSALARMHNVKRIHLDLKASNMYVCKVDHPYIRIIDLGSSFDLKKTNYDNRNFAYITTEGYQSRRIKKLVRLSNESVDLFKTALSELSFKDDIYAMAETFFELLFGTTFSFDPDFGYPGYCECEESECSYGSVYEKMILKICSKAAYEKYNTIEEMKEDIDSLIKIINREGYDSSIVKNKSIEYVKSLEIKNTIITDFVPPVENLTVNFSEYIKSEMSDKGGVQIIGEGGSGKSYFLIKTAAELQNDSDVIPLYIPLSQTKSDYGYSIFHYINNVFLEKTSSGGKDEIRKNICMMINQQEVIMPYKYVFLLDGLNEVVVDENVNGNINLYDEISSLSNLKNTFIVVSTRFQLMQPIFSYMSVKRLCPLSRERIEAILKEKKLTISDWYLLEIIRTPFYLMLFLSLYGTEKNYPVLDFYKRVDLIRDYFDFQLNKLELSNDLLQRRQYDIIYNNILPAVAKWTLENEYAFQKKVLTECVEAHRTDLDKMNSDEIIDLIIKSGLVVEFNSNGSGLYYSFNHEIYRDYFGALAWNNLYEESLNGEFVDFAASLCFTLNSEVIKNIGDLKKEYLYKDGNSDSPCGKMLDRGRGIFGSRDVQNYNRFVTEIIMKARNGLAGFDFHNLDLRLCDLSDVNVSNADFCGSTAVRRTFISDYIPEGELRHPKKVLIDGNVLYLLSFQNIYAYNYFTHAIMFKIVCRGICDFFILNNEIYVYEEEISCYFFVYKKNTGEHIRTLFLYYKDSYVPSNIIEKNIYKFFAFIGKQLWKREYKGNFVDINRKPINHGFIGITSNGIIIETSDNTVLFLDANMIVCGDFKLKEDLIAVAGNWLVSYIDNKRLRLTKLYVDYESKCVKVIDEFICKFDTAINIESNTKTALYDCDLDIINSYTKQQEINSNVKNKVNISYPREAKEEDVNTNESAVSFDNEDKTLIFETKEEMEEFEKQHQDSPETFIGISTTPKKEVSLSQNYRIYMSQNERFCLITNTDNWGQMKGTIWHIDLKRRSGKKILFPKNQGYSVSICDKFFTVSFRTLDNWEMISVDNNDYKTTVLYSNSISTDDIVNNHVIINDDNIALITNKYIKFLVNYRIGYVDSIKRLSGYHRHIIYGISENLEIKMLNADFYGDFTLFRCYLVSDKKVKKPQKDADILIVDNRSEYYNTFFVNGFLYHHCSLEYLSEQHNVLVLDNSTDLEYAVIEQDFQNKNAKLLFNINLYDLSIVSRNEVYCNGTLINSRAKKIECDSLEDYVKFQKMCFEIHSFCAVENRLYFWASKRESPDLISYVDLNTYQLISVKELSDVVDIDKTSIKGIPEEMSVKLNYYGDRIALRRIIDGRIAISIHANNVAFVCFYSIHSEKKQIIYLPDMDSEDIDELYYSNKKLFLFGVNNVVYIYKINDDFTATLEKKMLITASSFNDAKIDRLSIIDDINGGTYQTLLDNGAILNE